MNALANHALLDRSRRAKRVKDEKALVRSECLDRTLILSVLAILSIGLVMVASSSITVADRQMGQPLYYLLRQLVFVFVGLLLSIPVLKIRLEHWQNNSTALLILALLLLTLVLVPGIGKQVNGSTRWLPIGFFNLQVSEVAKLLLLMYVASYLVRFGEQVRTSSYGFIKPLMVLSVTGVLLLLQPDFGAAVVLLTTCLGMLYLAGVRLWQFLFLLLIGATVLTALAVFTPYRMVRLMTFLDPWADPFNSGFQLTQSLIAIGRGEWFGVGLGGSVQKLFYLPEAHTDFVFAVLAEETGLLGAATVVLLFALWVWRAMLIGARAERAGHVFGAYMAYGIGLWVGVQAFINIGVNMGVLPTKGLTLPLMSYGGSSLIVTILSIALLLRVGHEVACEEGKTPRNRRSKKRRRQR